MPLVALLRDRQQVLASRLDEAHRPTECARQERDQDVLRVDDRLRTEAAADVLRDDAHRVLGDREVTRQQPPQDLRRLRRRPHGGLAQLTVPARRDRARLHRHAGAAMQMEVLAQHHGRTRELAGRIADALGESRRHVAAGMHAGPVGAESVIERSDRRQRFVVDTERAERVFGLSGGLGNDERDRLTRVRDDVLGQDLGTGRRDEARVRHEQRQPPERRDVGGHQHVDHARLPARFGRIDADDARVGMRAPVDRDVKQARVRHVVDVAAAPGDQPRVLAAAHSGAEQSLTHRGSSAAAAGDVQRVRRIDSFEQLHVGEPGLA